MFEFIDGSFITTNVRSHQRTAWIEEYKFWRWGTPVWGWAAKYIDMIKHLTTSKIGGGEIQRSSDGKSWHAEPRNYDPTKLSNYEEG